MTLITVIMIIVIIIIIICIALQYHRISTREFLATTASSLRACFLLRNYFELPDVSVMFVVNVVCSLNHQSVAVAGKINVGWNDCGLLFSRLGRQT